MITAWTRNAQRYLTQQQLQPQSAQKQPHAAARTPLSLSLTSNPHAHLSETGGMAHGTPIGVRVGGCSRTRKCITLKPPYQDASTCGHKPPRHDEVCDRAARFACAHARALTHTHAHKCALARARTLTHTHAHSRTLTHSTLASAQSASAAGTLRK